MAPLNVHPKTLEKPITVSDTLTWIYVFKWHSCTNNYWCIYRRFQFFLLTTTITTYYTSTSWLLH